VSAGDWARVSQQLSVYNLRHDSETCELSSDRVLIPMLDEPSNLNP
jgi:hypothetical protein